SHGTTGIGADTALLYLLDDAQSLHLVASAGFDSSALGPWQRLSANDETPVSDAVRTRTTVILRDRAESARRYPTMARGTADDAAVVALPLVIRNSVLGALVFTFTRPHDFTDADLTMLATLAG